MKWIFISKMVTFRHYCIFQLAIYNIEHFINIIWNLKHQKGDYQRTGFMFVALHFINIWDKMTYICRAAGVVVSCKIPILATRVRFPGGALVIFLYNWTITLRSCCAQCNWMYTAKADLTDEVAEWLRRWTANPLGSARVGSNPILVAWFWCLSQVMRNEYKNNCLHQIPSMGLVKCALTTGSMV